ncbi:MAG TPA: AmpG family muropeptide MFS transporter, partial [Pseudomonas sp.]|nr:AmpG family muropeptide MFS transporter [Pseudomonas sp.]
RMIGGYSGVLVEKFGYEQFFIITALLGVPTLILIILQWRRERPQANGSAPAATVEHP